MSHPVALIPEKEVSPVLDLRFTRHARMRMAQQGIREHDVETAVACGSRFHWRGALHCWMGRREVLKWKTQGLHLDHLERLHVVVCDEKTVVTVGYRSRHPRGHGRHRSGRPRRRRPW